MKPVTDYYIGLLLARRILKMAGIVPGGVVDRWLHKERKRRGKEDAFWEYPVITTLEMISWLKQGLTKEELEVY